jgi:hypothetical protein
LSCLIGLVVVRHDRLRPPAAEGQKAPSSPLSATRPSQRPLN